MHARQRSIYKHYLDEKFSCVSANLSCQFQISYGCDDVEIRSHVAFGYGCFQVVVLSLFLPLLDCVRRATVLVWVPPSCIQCSDFQNTATTPKVFIIQFQPNIMESIVIRVEIQTFS